VILRPHKRHVAVALSKEKSRGTCAITQTAGQESRSRVAKISYGAKKKRSQGPGGIRLWGGVNHGRLSCQKLHVLPGGKPSQQAQENMVLNGEGNYIIGLFYLTLVVKQ